MYVEIKKQKNKKNQEKEGSNNGTHLNLFNLRLHSYCACNVCQLQNHRNPSL